MHLSVSRQGGIKGYYLKMKNIMTVDVEDWYHICDIEHLLPPSQWDRCETRILINLEKILTLFSRFKVKATFFVLGYIAERKPEVVKMIYQEGHEIASHGYGHLQVYKQKKEEFTQDLLRSKNLIEGISALIKRGAKERKSLDDVKAEYITEILKEVDGNKKIAAEILKVNPRTLYRFEKKNQN